MKTILKIAGKLVKWYLKATLWFWAAIGASYVCKEYANQCKAGYQPSAMDVDSAILDQAVDNYKELARQW